MDKVIVAETGDSWIKEVEGVEVIDAGVYLTTPEWNRRRGLKVYNLSRSVRYQTSGYYVSLLAEARGHRPVPSVMAIQDLDGRAAVRLIPQALDELIQKSFASLQTDEFSLSVYFAQNLAKKHEKLARELFNLFQAPLLRFVFARQSKWRLRKARVIGLNDVPKSHRPFVVEAAVKHFNHKWSAKRSTKNIRFDMAILHDPNEGDLAPSNEKALQRISKAAATLGVATELITKEDAGRLLEFDALFIRETTAVHDHTYRIARRAQQEGLVVIDDPVSILRCTNKVFLAELLQKAKIATPKSMVVHRGNIDEVLQELGLPCVLKRPDSAFSKGVVKVKTEDELSQQLACFFEDSDLVLAQQFMQTDFDWRIGVLDQKPLFACKYHMARGHWQIARHRDGQKTTFGKCETMPVEMAPRKAVSIATRAANLIGDGFYGVDVKESNGNFYIIEVNDNPNLDAGIEDLILRDELYLRIMESIVRRIEKNKA